MNLEFEFEQSAWELALANLRRGDSLSALRFLTLLEGEEESRVEEAFEALQELGVTLDIRDLPQATVSGELAARLRQEEALVRKGRLPEGLEETDPLKIYLDELSGIPVCGDIQALSLDLAEANRRGVSDSPAHKRVMDLCLSRIVELARSRAGNGVLLIDLIQEGSMGLWQGLFRYDGSEDIETFRDCWIESYMARAIVMQARENGVGQKMRQLCDDYRRADKALLTKLGRNPTLEEIALELHITWEDASVVEQLIGSASLLAKAREASQPKQQQPEDDQAVEDTAYFQSRQRIAEMLSGLTEREATLISLRFGLEGGLPLSPQDTGKKLGLTSDEVVALEAAALSKLREAQN